MTKGFAEPIKFTMDNPRIINVELSKIPARIARKLAKKYGNMTAKEFMHVGGEVGMQMVSEYVKEKMNEGDWAKIILDNQFTFLVIKENNQLMYELEHMKETLGQDEISNEEVNEVIEQAANKYHSIPETEFYQHPLADTFSVPGANIPDEENLFCNNWMLASFMINGIRGLFGEPDDGGSAQDTIAKNTRMLTKFINRIDPTIQVDALVAAIKLHRLQAMQKVCNLIGSLDNNTFKVIFEQISAEEGISIKEV